MSYCSSVTLLFFEEDQSALSDTELEILKTWLKKSRSNPATKVLVIGGAFDTPRAGRVRRLDAIRIVLEGMGMLLFLPPSAEDRCVPTGLDVTDSLPTDVAWIGYRDPQSSGNITPRLFLGR